MWDKLRPVPAAELVRHAADAGRLAGVTRLADVTRLDTIGMPVWQAIRPMSKALSVHQGRGATQAEAQLGALMEAVESHSAENFDAICCSSSWDQLPHDLKVGEWGDFSRDRSAAPPSSSNIEWSRGETLDGRAGLVPFDCVSMDLTRRIGTGLERSSNGLAAGFTRESSRMGALLELIERDSLAAWRAHDMAERMEGTLDLNDTGLDWLDQWRDALAAVGCDLQCYNVPSLTGTPVIAAEIADHGKSSLAYRAMEGTGAHPSAEVALWRAISEAIQCRSIYVAGSRDDILPKDYDPPREAVQVVFGLPPPPGMATVSLSAIADGETELVQLCDRIEVAGLGPVLFVEVAVIGGIFVTKAFAPGLGHRQRARRQV